MRETTRQKKARNRRERRDVLADLVTARQAAAIKGCSEKAVYTAINKRRLPADRVGAFWMVSRRAVEAWVLIGHRPVKTKRRNIDCLRKDQPGGESNSQD